MEAADRSLPSDHQTMRDTDNHGARITEGYRFEMLVSKISSGNGANL